MTSAATHPARGIGRQRGESYGLIVFASVLLVITGCLNLIHGIAAIANSHAVVRTARELIEAGERSGRLTPPCG